MTIPIYQIDAFASRPFAGNPAAVCPLEEWLDDATMQNIGAENNLSETAFFVREGDRYRLRWFTPTTEVDLCGHATLAAAHVLFNILNASGDEIRFESQSGPLFVRRDESRLVLNFPTRAPQSCPIPTNLNRALGAQPREVLRSRDLLCVFDSEKDVRSIKPDLELMRTLPADVIVTARGDRSDFVSRYFAPLFGIPEDPVTGSTHCTLIPYWGEMLHKKKMLAHQVSKRGGEVFCEWNGDRVMIGGYATEFLRGTIHL